MLDHIMLHVKDYDRSKKFCKHYHDNYYGAFVTDLDGNNVEAVCHKPE